MSKIDRRELRTSATPEQVWDAWARPEHIERWFADRATGEPVPGGTITHVFEKFGLELPHKVIESIPGEKLVVEAVGPTGVPFRQEVRVRRDGGDTVLELVHSGFGDDADWASEFEGVDSGWQMAFGALKLYVERYFGRARTGYFVTRPAQFEFDKVVGPFHTAEGRKAWLSGSDAPRLGDELVWTGREAALSWPEVDGMFELKAFSMGPRQALGLRAHSWAQRPPAVADVEAWMTAALGRLVEQL